MMITTVGIDLAKSVFQVHGVDEQGNTVLRKQLKREQLRYSRPPCRRVGWGWMRVAARITGRASLRASHTVKLMSPHS
jgi:transposase